MNPEEEIKTSKSLKRVHFKVKDEPESKRIRETNPHATQSDEKLPESENLEVPSSEEEEGNVKLREALDAALERNAKLESTIRYQERRMDLLIRESEEEMEDAKQHIKELKGTLEEIQAEADTEGEGMYRRCLNCQGWEDVVKEKNELIRERDWIIEERDMTIEDLGCHSCNDMEESLEEREEAIKKRDQTIEERDRTIGERDKVIEEKDRTIRNKEEIINKIQAYLADVHSGEEE